MKEKLQKQLDEIKKHLELLQELVNDMDETPASSADIGGDRPPVKPPNPEP